MRGGWRQVKESCRRRSTLGKHTGRLEYSTCIFDASFLTCYRHLHQVLLQVHNAHGLIRSCYMPVGVFFGGSYHPHVLLRQLTQRAKYVQSLYYFKFDFDSITDM